MCNLKSLLIELYTFTYIYIHLCTYTYITLSKISTLNTIPYSVRCDFFVFTQ